MGPLLDFTPRLAMPLRIQVAACWFLPLRHVVALSHDSVVSGTDYSPSPECSARKSGDEWRGEPSEALAKEG